MTSAASLQPTLWRTCRVLANRLRLKMFGVVAQEPGQTVSVVAKRVHVPVAVASQYLRALEARGFLEARRNKRWVEYRPLDPENTKPGNTLAGALAREFQSKKAVETAFRLVTAFTHPRRIEIYRALVPRAQTLEELAKSTGIPWRTLLRHLSKLRTRGFVLHRGLHPREYAVAAHPSPFGCALAEAAAAGGDAPPQAVKPVPQGHGILADQSDFID